MVFRTPEKTGLERSIEMLSILRTIYPAVPDIALNRDTQFSRGSHSLEDDIKLGIQRKVRTALVEIGSRVKEWRGMMAINSPYLHLRPT